MLVVMVPRISATGKFCADEEHVWERWAGAGDLTEKKSLSIGGDFSDIHVNHPTPAVPEDPPSATHPAALPPAPSLYAQHSTAQHGT